MAKAVTHTRADAPRQDSAGLRSPGWFGKWPMIGVMMFLVGALAFGALAYNVETHGPLLQWDQPIAQEMHRDAVRGPASFDNFMNLGFYIGKQVVQILAVLLALYFLMKRMWPELLMVLIGLGGEAALWYLLTRFFDRPRPPTQMGVIVTEPSFPSGHTATAILCYGLLAYLWVPHIRSVFWKWAVSIAILLLIIYIGYSRVFMGGHYLTDVIAGYALGIGWMGLVYTIVERAFRRTRRAA